MLWHFCGIICDLLLIQFRPIWINCDILLFRCVIYSSAEEKKSKLFLLLRVIYWNNIFFRTYIFLWSFSTKLNRKLLIWTYIFVKWCIYLYIVIVLFHYFIFPHFCNVNSQDLYMYVGTFNVNSPDLLDKYI